MNKIDAAIGRLEAARSALEESPARALRLLEGARGLPRALRAEGEFLRAEALRAMGYFARAEAAYARAVAGAQGDAPLRVEALLGSAAGLRSVGTVARARERLRTAASAVRAARLPGYGGRLALEKALVERAAGRYEESVRLLDPMLGRALARGDHAEAAFLLWAVGGARRFQGRLRDSERAFRRSLALARRAGDPAGAGYALFGLGGVTRILGRLRDSARHYAAAGRAFRGTEDAFGRAYAECGLANALRQQGRLAEAERLYRRAHALYSSLGDPVDLAYVDWGLGQVHLHRGELGQAVRRHRAALDAFRRGGETRGVVHASQSLAQALHALGRTREAEALFARAYSLARRKGIHAHLEVYT